MPKGVYTRKIPVWNKGLKGVMKPNKTTFIKGMVAWNKGIPSPWTSERNKITNPTKRGAEAFHWKGGTYGTERHRDMGRQEYKQWRSDVFERDNWTCQTCQARGIYLEAHHIKPWKHYPELRYDTGNGITLCRPCHVLTFKENK